MKHTAAILMIFMLILLGVGFASPALADDVLIGTDTPRWGEVNIGLIEFPDPFIVTAIGGGPIDAHTQDGMPDACRGFVSSNPDHRVNIVADNLALLRIMFVSSGDSTLIVQFPDGSWQCNDDSGIGSYALSPMLDIPNPAEGSYNVWIGSFAGDQNLPGYLMYTQNQSTYPGQIVTSLFGSVLDPNATNITTTSGAISSGTTSSAESCAGGINYTCTPNFGSVSLASGFVPDPFTVHVTSGGSINVTEQGLPAVCVGNITTAPDFRLQLTSNSARIRIYFVADVSGSDSTLIVNTAGTTWLCNDDYDNFNPMIEIDSASSGQYDIWVGSYTTGQFISGTLYISELDTTPANP